VGRNETADRYGQYPRLSGQQLAAVAAYCCATASLVMLAALPLVMGAGAGAGWVWAWS